MISLLIALVLAQPADPYVRTRALDSDDESNCLYWADGTTIEYRQAQAGNPGTPSDTEFTAITRSFSTWSAQFEACGSLRLREGPRSATRTIGRDAENLIVFRQTRCTDVVPPADACFQADTCGNLFDCWAYSGLAIAVTTTTFRPESGQILDADIEFNAGQYTFSTVDAPPCTPPVLSSGCVSSDVENTATHEVGHALGLGHILLSNSTMSPNASPGETSKRSLDPGSRAFICETYPVGRPAQNCVIKPFGLSEGYVQELGKAGGGCGCGAAEGGPLLVLALILRRRLSRR